MAEGQVATEIDRPGDEAWRIIADFGGLDTWMPGVDGCTLDGDVRTVNMLGMAIEEQLLSRDDATRTLTYSITGGLPGLEHHEATIRVADVGSGCRVTWDVETRPDGMLDIMTGAYDGALQVLKAKLEG